MSVFLGIDTSNYTTSAALYDRSTQTAAGEKQLLPVKQGALGLRQSDAVFHHVRQLPAVMGRLFANTDAKPCAVGYSARPRDEDGSYMPCFLAGECAAKAVAAAAAISAYAFSHQAGHLAAALYSAGRLDLIDSSFLAFHVSGGTTECLYVTPHPEQIFQIQRIGQSLDLKAGQVIDRVGTMLGLSFPAGMALDTLAQQSARSDRITPTIRGMDCCLSGLENQCKRMIADGEAPCDVAHYCIEYIAATLARMTELAIAAHGALPLLYAGGVMSNSMIRSDFSRRFGGLFAAPDFSSDNAAGIAILASLRHTGRV
ncbi:MAG: peptidase M22 [Acetanaerobacterium sp.]